GCARCHDHKYDPISHKEFYNFYAFFNNVDETGRVDEGGNARPVLRLPTDEQQHELDELSQTIAGVEEQLDSVQPPSDRELAEWEQAVQTALEREQQGTLWSVPVAQRATA